MNRYITDRGIQAAISSGVVLAAMAVITDAYRPVYIALGVTWVAVTAMAVIFARRKRVR